MFITVTATLRLEHAEGSGMTLDAAAPASFIANSRGGVGFFCEGKLRTSIWSLSHQLSFYFHQDLLIPFSYEMSKRGAGLEL